MRAIGRNVPAAFLLALVLPASAGPIGENPPPAPEGFTWKRIESVKAAFLIPKGWYFKEETKGDTRAFFITQEDIDKTGEFETGLTVNVTKLKKDPAQLRAANFIAVMSESNELQDFGQMESGVLKGFGCRVRKVEKGFPPLIMHVLAIGNSRTNTLYLLIFESPESKWEAAWSKGETILGFFLLDDEV